MRDKDLDNVEAECRLKSAFITETTHLKVSLPYDELGGLLVCF